jgi:hypothetical protein
LAILIFVEGRRKKINNVVDSKRNYFFNSKSTARIHLKKEKSLAGLTYYSNAGHIKTLAGRMWPVGHSLGGADLDENLNS